MGHKEITQSYQMRQREPSQESGILQRAAVRSVSDAQLQSTEDKQVQPLGNSVLSKDFSRVPISTTKPQRIMTKLTIGSAENEYERDADRVAKEVVQRINAPASVRLGEDETVQGEEMETKDNKARLMRSPILQRKSSDAGMTATPELEASINRARGGGQPMADNIRQPMEKAFSADFSRVKIHTNSQSDQLNQSIQARAFTTGQDVFFRQGAYEPESRGGQELIAHELTHIVQQNGGAVQRKVAYKNPSKTKISEVKKALKKKFKKKNKIFKDEDQNVINTILTSEFPDDKLFKALNDLSDDKQDYGTFDLNNDQHLMLLFHAIKKRLNLPLPNEESEKENKAAENKEKEQKEYFAKSPDPSMTFETAFLGAGAATAYYLTTMGSSFDRDKAIVIGPKQPWAGERGPGVINHPMHMIDALRKEVGLGDESLAPREKFSEIVEKVIKKYVILRRLNKIEQVTKISNKGEAYYQIKVEKDITYYAKKVVAGLGIGPHITPKNQTPLKDRRAINMDEFQKRASKIKLEVEKPQDITVVISGGNAAIDAVMTSIHNGFKIIWVTGSQRPALLPGTDNETVEEEYDKVIQQQASKISQVIKRYAKIAKENPEPDKGKPIIVETDEGEIQADYFVYAMGPDISKIKDVFNKEIVLNNLVPTYDKNRQFGSEGLSTVVGLEVKNRSKDDKTSLEIIGGSAFRMAGDVEYDYLSGQYDLLNSMLSDLLSDNLSSVPKVFQTTYKTCSDELPRMRNLLTKIKNATQLSDLSDVATAPKFSEATLKIESLERNQAYEGLKQKYLSFLRFIESYATMLTNYTESVKEYLQKKAEAEQNQKRLRAPDPRTAGVHMGKVIETLPLNIAVNDQLTPTRSQIEATQAFVPRYVTEDVNFATDSSTVLSIYISVNFPNLSDQQVDEWVDRIIRWRRPSEDDRKKYTMLHGPIPNPKGKSRENALSFGKWFKKCLAEENAKAAEEQK